MARKQHHFVLAALLFGVLLAACGGTTRAAIAPPKAVLRIACELPDAEIWLDSRFFHEVAEVRGGIRLSPGTHRLEVRHPAYHSMYYEVQIQQGEQRTLDVKLAKRLH